MASLMQVDQFGSCPQHHARKDSTCHDRYDVLVQSSPRRSLAFHPATMIIQKLNGGIARAHGNIRVAGPQSLYWAQRQGHDP